MAPYSGLASYTALATSASASTAAAPAAPSKGSIPTSPGRAHSAAMPSSQATATDSAAGTSAPEAHWEMDSGRITASSAGGAAPGAASARKRSYRVRNSSEVNSRRTVSGSHGRRSNKLASVSRGTSSSSRPSLRLSFTWSAHSSMPFRILGVSSAACSMMPSMLPYFSRRRAAVLSPTPGTPGRLSACSPLRAAKSVQLLGPTP